MYNPTILAYCPKCRKWFHVPIEKAVYCPACHRWFYALDEFAPRLYEPNPIKARKE